MPTEKPIVYILRGDDQEAVENHCRQFVQRLGNAETAAMNTTRLDGSASLNDLRAAALALPFLAERRLVIVDDALRSYSGKSNRSQQSALLQLFDTLPESTALVLILPDELRYRSGRTDWVTYHNRHWLIAWADQSGGRSLIIDCPLPSKQAMIGWIKQKAVDLGGSFSAGAQIKLADYVGNDTLRATSEIEKLLTYVNFERPVDGVDVQELTTQEQEANIFHMVDAIGMQDAQKAMSYLHILAESEELLPIFGMIIRQFRLMLQIRELLALGKNEKEMAATLNLNAFVVEKMAAQARRFDLRSLERIYHQLLKIDLDSKSFGMDLGLALDVLIARLAN